MLDTLAAIGPWRCRSALLHQRIRWTLGHMQSRKPQVQKKRPKETHRVHLVQLPLLPVQTTRHSVHPRILRNRRPNPDQPRRTSLRRSDHPQPGPRLTLHPYLPQRQQPRQVLPRRHVRHPVDLIQNQKCHPRNLHPNAMAMGRPQPPLNVPRTLRLRWKMQPSPQNQSLQQLTALRLQPRMVHQRRR